LTISFGNANYGLMGTMYSGTGGGKFYFEVSGTNVGGIYNTIVFVGFKDASGNYWGYQVYNGDIASNLGASAYDGTGYGSGGWPTIGIAVDATAGKIWFRNNSGWYGSGDPASGANPAFTNVTTQVSPYFNGGGGGYSGTLNFNFGQQPFTYTAPSGYLGLNTYNLSTPTIPNGAVYMAATTYTGTGATQSVVNTINGTNFQPDFLWIKSRSSGAANSDNQTFNSVMGHGKVLYTNLTNAEFDSGTAWYSIASNGFTLTSNVQLNTSAVTYVAWQWKTNGGSTVTNTDGTITSTVSANTTAGFSIATFSGASGGTVGHGLGVAPQMIFIKSRTTATGWYVYTSTIGANGWLVLETTAAAVTGNPAAFGGTPTSTVWTYGAGLAGTGNYVAYCFAPIAGFSAFGSYTGNGSTDGPFVYTGFRPRFVMVKCSSNSTSSTVWTIFDTSRSPYNASVNELYPNLSAAEGVDSSGIDILSNGFKPKRNSEYANLSGWTYIYMAFAENPFKYSNAR
jgi:hypothetical protein